MANSNWTSNRPRQNYALDGGGPDADVGWTETAPFISDMLDGNTYPAPFEGPPLQRPEYQTHRPYGHRGRPAAQPQRAGDSLEYPVEPLRTPPNIRQNAANRSWLDLSNQDTMRAHPSISLSDQREEVRQEIENLARKFIYLQNKLAKFDELDTKYIELSEKLVCLEDGFRIQMKENNESVSAWLREVKSGVERLQMGNTRMDGGTGEHSDVNLDRIEGTREEALSGMQSTAFDFLK